MARMLVVLGSEDCASFQCREGSCTESGTYCTVLGFGTHCATKAARSAVRWALGAVMDGCQMRDVLFALAAKGANGGYIDTELHLSSRWERAAGYYSTVHFSPQ